MNELISAIKIIKFSGETKNWKAKALAARDAEMKLWVKVSLGQAPHTNHGLG